MLVTGLKWISDSFSVPFPQYMPLMVLHDPPGGQSIVLRRTLFDLTGLLLGLSTASYVNDQATSTISIKSSAVSILDVDLVLPLKHT